MQSLLWKDSLRCVSRRAGIFLDNSNAAIGPAVTRRRFHIRICKYDSRFDHARGANFGVYLPGRQERGASKRDYWRLEHYIAATADSGGNVESTLPPRDFPSDILTTMAVEGSLPVPRLQGAALKIGAILLSCTRGATSPTAKID